MEISIWAEPTRVSKSSAAIRALPFEPPEPELEPLIPAEPSLNLACYSLWLESIIRDQVKG